MLGNTIFTGKQVQLCGIDKWLTVAFRTASSSILSVVYDLPSIQSPEDPIFAFMDELVSGGSEALLPGSHLVETFPILDCLPDSLAKWRTRARAKFQRWSAALEEMFLRIKNKSVSDLWLCIGQARI